MSTAQQVTGHRFQLADALVGANRFADGKDSYRRPPFLDHMAKHVHVGVVGDAWFSDPPQGRPDCCLGAVDGFPVAEVELVVRASAPRPALADQLDPLRVLDTLARFDHQSDLTSLIWK